MSKKQKWGTFWVFILLTIQIKLVALTAGVAIPCYYKHFNYLPALLESIGEQTRLPEEVVISLSQVELLTEEVVDGLANQPWPFKLTIIRRIGIFMEGSNRTCAAKQCTTDIVLCIDADDVPHPQRIEAVMQLFEEIPNAAVVLCGHAYCPGESIICDPAIPFFFPKEYSAMRFDLNPETWVQLNEIEDLQRWHTGVHNGSPSIRRPILEDAGVYWTDLKNGADQEFNRLTMLKYRETYMIMLPLLHYYNARSSGQDIGR